MLQVVRPLVMEVFAGNMVTSVDSRHRFFISYGAMIVMFEFLDSIEALQLQRLNQWMY